MPASGHVWDDGVYRLWRDRHGSPGQARAEEKKQEAVNRKMLKPTLLSLSLLTVMSGAAVAPAMARIAMAFPDISQTAVKSVLTFPAVFIIIFSLLSGPLSSRVSKRSILQIGLCFYLVGGLGGGLVHSFAMLLFFRAVLGIGVGLLMPLSTGLIADFFDGEERAQLIGYATAAQNLGGIIATITSGMLAVLSWRYSFGVYGFGLLVLMLVLFYLPELEVTTRRQEARRRLPGRVYLWGLGAFVLMVAFYAIPVNMAMFIQDNSFGDASIAGMVISVLTTCGFFAGLSYGKVKLRLKSLLPVVMIALMACGFFLLSRAASLPEVLIAISVIGVGCGWAMPTLIHGATQAGGKGEGVQVMAIVSSMIFFGQFLSPLVLDALGGLVGNANARTSFVVIAYGYAALLIVTILYRVPIVAGKPKG